MVIGYFRNIFDVPYLLSMTRIYTPASIYVVADASNGFPLSTWSLSKQMSLPIILNEFL